MVTVLEVLRGATEFLRKKEIESPRLNAELLLAHVLGLKRLELYLEFDRPLGESHRAPMRELTRARGDGRPLQHLLGSVEFFGRTFLCDERALIPRPETEQLVGLCLEHLPPGAERIADVGTGSGVIALSLALERPELEVLGTDLSRDALELARENGGRHGASAEWLEADLLPPCRRFHAVVANLPYIATGELARLPREVRHDPVMALDGGPDGLGLIARLAETATESLEPCGLLALEIGAGQEDAVAAILAERNYRDIRVFRDYQNVPRFVFATHG